MKLQEGDIWLSKREKPYNGLYFLRVRVWRKRAWRFHGQFWGLEKLVDQNTNKGLLKIENRPQDATYTGVYRYTSG